MISISCDYNEYPNLMKMDKVIKKFYLDLVTLLPMDDATFRAKLHAAGLLPGNLKDELKYKPTAADKAEHFLDNGIKSDSASFLRLLSIMSNSDNYQLKEIAEKVKEEIEPCRDKTDVSQELPLTKKRKIDVSISTTSSLLIDHTKDRLKTRYKSILNSDFPNKHRYVQLALINQCSISHYDRDLNEITRLTLQGQVDEILEKKEQLNGLKDVFHYRDTICPKLILILGAPGIGKTTLANEICCNWVEEGFLCKDYNLIILIPLRAIQERSLKQVVIEYIGQAAYDDLVKSYGAKCLIVLDGLDEVSAHWQETDEMFLQLLKKRTVLEQANILVTSRPHACIRLYSDRDVRQITRRIEIVGFNQKQIKEYVELCCDNSTTVEKFMEQLENFPHIRSLCYVPLCLNMVLQSFQHNNEVLYCTLTELYHSFILSKIDEHFNLKKCVPLGRVPDSDKELYEHLKVIVADVPAAAQETVFLLSKLAYHSWFGFYSNDSVKRKRRVTNPKVIYSTKELAECNIAINSESDAFGLLKTTHALYGHLLLSNTAVYNFNHLSIQEYFCSLYISLLPEDIQLQLFKSYINDYPNIWPFYAGITKLKSLKMNIADYLYLKLSVMNFRKYGRGSTNVISARNDQYNFQGIVTVLNSIHEAQQPAIYDNKQFMLILDSTVRLLPYDCMSISYFMSVASITHLYVPQCYIGDQGAEMLARYTKTSIPLLKVIELTENNLTTVGIQHIANIVECSSNLNHLSVADNHICNEGIALLTSTELPFLKRLEIYDVEMSSTGAFTLANYLKNNISLQSLEISRNDINNDGLQAILNSLQFNCTLIQLIAINCMFSFDGAVSLGCMLRKNKTLKYLAISVNSIGDDGITAISEGIQENTTLIQLIASDCNFSCKGAVNISKMLQNSTLQGLDISENKIGDDGITAIAKALVNSNLTQLAVNDCNLGDVGINYLTKSLNTTNLKELQIKRNKCITSDHIGGLIHTVTTNKLHTIINNYDPTIKHIHESDSRKCLQLQDDGNQLTDIKEWMIDDDDSYDSDQDDNSKLLQAIDIANSQLNQMTLHDS